MIDTPRDPQTLADVQPGDMVWLFALSAPLRRVAVDRLTKTQIIVGGMRFRRFKKTTPAYSYSFRRDHTTTTLWDGEGLPPNQTYYVAVGKSARITVLSWHMKKLGWFNYPTKSSITAARASHDAAESALRELGEWTDGDG
jgi:hypothetical protein